MTNQKMPAWSAIVAWIGTAAVVPSAVAVVRWQEVIAHPADGALLLAVAVVLTPIAGLGHGLWRARYRDRCISWLSDALDRRISRFGRMYRRHLASELRFVDLAGVPGHTFDPDLADVYVDVALHLQNGEGSFASDFLAVRATLPEPGERHLIGDFLGADQPRVIAVIGPPGSGKTTLLRHTARAMCSRPSLRRGRNMPILLTLRDHAATIAADPGLALSSLASAVMARYGLTEPRGWFDQQLGKGRCLVMLDGLDEVARQEDRQAVSRWVADQRARYPGNDFIVTARPLGYFSAPITGAITVQTQPFTAEQVTRFVYAWYLAEERHETAFGGRTALPSGSDDLAIRHKARDRADDLLVRLRAAPALKNLCANPLLLTMIAIVHRHRGALPGTRADLYGQICQVLLWRRQDAKKMVIEPRGEQKERLMRVVAFEMMHRRVRDLPSSHVLPILRPALRRIARDLTAEDFLRDVAVNGIFIEREADVRAFAHPTFQEYLAAAHIKDKGLESTLINNVNDIWWHETTLLYVAAADGGPIVRACLASGTREALALALACGEEAAELDENLRDALDELLAAGLMPGADPHHRRMMAGIAVGRHLRQTLAISSGISLCQQPVSNRIYKLFLDDMAERATPRPPDAPAEYLDDPSSPVIGIRSEDAAVFVDWANEIVGGNPGYRLPYPVDIQDPDTWATLSTQQHLSAGIWAQSAGSPQTPQLVTARRIAQSSTVPTAVIRSHLITDFRSAPLTTSLLPLITPARVAALFLAAHGMDSLTPLTAPVNVAHKLLLGYVGQRESGLAEKILVHDAALGREDLNEVFAQALTHQDSISASSITEWLELAHAYASSLPDPPENLRNSLREAVIAARDLDRVLTSNANDLLRDIAEVLGSSLMAQVDAGPALSRTAARRISQQSVQLGPDLLASELAYEFTAATLKEESYEISPDQLPETVSAAITQITTRPSIGGPQPLAWTRHATKRLASLMAPITARRQSVTQDVAGALRILSLSLATQADVTCQDLLVGDKFRQIGATVTWLERRHNGQDQPAGGMILASGNTVSS